MTRTAQIFNGSGQTEQLQVLGTQIDLLSQGGFSDGFSVTIQAGAEKIGPPPDSHDWDEAFYILEGRVNFQADGAPVQLGAGAYVFIPAGTIHAFSFAEGGGKMLEITGNRSRSADLFRQLNDECATLPPEMSQVVRVFNENSVQLHI